MRLQVDMLVGDIYGGRDYTGIGLSANTIASSFGKVLHEGKVGEAVAGAGALGVWEGRGIYGRLQA